MFILPAQVSNQKSILDVMLGFLQVAKDFENKGMALFFFSAITQPTVRQGVFTTPALRRGAYSVL